MNEAAKQKQREYMREYQKKNRERINKNNREWRRQNKDKVKEYNKRYWERQAQEMELNQID